MKGENKNMNKLLRKLAATLLGFAIAAGVGVTLSSRRNGATETKATDFTLASASSVTKDGITVSFAIASGGTAPTWYNAGLRLYASNTITVSCSDDIGSITFNWEKQGSKAFASVTANTGTYTHPSTTGDGTWSGTAKEIVFTLGGSGQLQLNTLSVTKSSGGGSGSTAKTIKFHSNTGTGSMADDSSESDTYTLPPCNFTAPSGKKFIGWKAENSGDLILPGASASITNGITFYAQWETANLTTDTLTADGLELTGSYSSFSYEGSSGATYIGYAMSATKSDVKCIQTNNNGTPTNRTIGTSVSGGYIRCIYLTFSETASNKYTIKVKDSAYDITKTFNEGTDYGILNNSTLRINITGDHSFVTLWPSGTMYPSSVSFVWETNTTTTQLNEPTNLLYDSANQKFTWDAVPNASSYEYTKDNGTTWTAVTSSSDRYQSVSGNDWVAGTEYTVKVRAIGTGNYTTSNASAALVFTKSLETYTLTYDGNGSTSGTVPTDGQSPYTSGTNVTVAGNTGDLAKSVSGLDFVFNGWNTKADGSGFARAAGSQFSITENTILYAQWADPSPDSGAKTYNLGSHSDFANWGSSYSEHSLSYSEEFGSVAVNFESANKQTSTITDMPVTTGKYVEFVLTSETHYISAITFIAKQWGTKTQTMTMVGSTDSGETYSTALVTSTIFKMRVSPLSTGTNAIKITFSNSSNQVGIDTFIVTYSTIPVTQATAITFTPESIVVDGGTQCSFTPTLTGGSGSYAKTINWTSSNTDVIAAPSASQDGDSVSVTPATVSQDTDVTLTATVQSPGSATGSIVITVKVVKTIVVTGVTVSGIANNATLDGNSDNTIEVDNTKALTANVSYQQGATYKDGTGSVTWSSSNTDVATVGESTGVVTYKGNGTVTITATSTENSQQSGSITFTITNINVRAGSIGNPFTVAEAIAYIEQNGQSQTDDYYVTGYVKSVTNNNTNHSYYLYDDPDEEPSSNADCIQAYSRSAPTGFDQYATGDKVVVKGYLSIYNSQKQVGKTDAGFSIISVDAETLSLNLSITEVSVTLNSSFTYNGTITADYKHKSDVIYDGEDSRFSIVSNVDTSNLGDYTYTVNYDDNLFEEISSSCTVHVVYAELTSFELSESSRSIPLNYSSIDLDDITVSVNANANPGYSWSLFSAKDASNNNMTAGTDYVYDSTEHTFESKGKPGTVIFRATSAGDSNIYADFTVTISGNPIITFDKESIQGIEGKTGTVSVSSIENMTGPYTYSWSVTDGSDVVSVTTGSSSSTLSFSKAGTATISLTVTDSNSVSKTSSLPVNVIKSLTTIEYTSSDKWELVTDVSELSADDEVIFVGSNTDSNSITTYYAMTTYVSGNNVRASSTTSGGATTYNTLSISNNIIQSGIKSDMIYTLKHDDSWASNVFEFLDSTSNGGKYLYAQNALNTSSGNYLKSTDEPGDNAKFEITLDNEGVFTIKVVGTTTGRGYLGFNYNNGSPMYACYQSTAAQANTAKLFKKIPGSTKEITNTNYNAQKAVIEFAEDLTSKLDSVCLKGEGGMTDIEQLDAKWALIKGTYDSKRNDLSSPDMEVFDALIANATPSDAQNADVLQKALSSYNYVVGKYKSQLTDGDFLTETGKDAIQESRPNQISIFGLESGNSITIIVIISMVSMTAIGGYFFLRKRKEQ